MNLHPTQLKIIKILKNKKSIPYSPRAIGRLLDIQNPQNIIYHVEKLKSKEIVDIKDGELFLTTISISINDSLKRNDILTIKKPSFLKLGIYGSMSCGPATIVAEENLEGYIIVSAEKLKRNTPKGLFVLRADGDSLNRANLNGKTVNSGDYVIIDSNKKIPKDGDYVLSIIDGLANLKKFKIDRKNKRIILESESTLKIPSIYIDMEYTDYIINGVAIDVIKNKE